MLRTQDIIVKPLLTEKSAVTTEKENRYAFVVNSKSNKFQIRSAVEKLFNVKVINVKTSVTAGKTKKFGATTKKLSSVKKAYVKIAEGQKIEFFQGV